MYNAISSNCAFLTIYFDVLPLSLVNWRQFFKQGRVTCHDCRCRHAAGAPAPHPIHKLSEAKKADKFSENCTYSYTIYIFHISPIDKRDDFNFHITNFPFLSSNIPSSPAYGVFISQLIRYARACSSYECFILRARRLSSKLLKQGYLVERLKSSFRKFYGRYGDLAEQYGVTLSRMLNDILTLDQQ